MPYINPKTGKRDYKREYTMYHGKPQQRKNRTARNAARAKVNAARKRRGLAPLKTTQEVDHIKPVSKGGGNGKSNTRVISRAKNRAKYNKTNAKRVKKRAKRRKK
jgi:5-methylcytosine-specific restriction endonuclease McrA